MATKMKMVMKGGKMVPAFAADGKGKMQMGGIKKLQKGGVKKLQKGGVKKMQYGGSNMSLGPVTDFTKIPRPASTTPTPAPAAAPAPTSVKEAREQARIAKINAKAKGYADGTIVPGKNVGRLIDAGVEGARLVNNAMESRRNQYGGTILKKATMKPKMQKGGGVKELLNPLTFAPSTTRKVVRRESKKNDKNIKIYNKKKPSLSPNEIKNLKGMTPPPIRNKMQNGGSTRPIPGRPGMNNEPVDYSKMGQGVLPKGTVVDSYYSRNKNKMKKTVNKLKRLPLVKGFSRAKNK